ncbi:putative nucleotidyltransferase [Pedobacter sp. CG_S7]|uniref:hypothetical protein n=1 Tax=Pedobacter sp. CG_S7 TaxID=3143930 RepID=UPI0033993122
MSNIYKIDLNKIRLENLKEVFSILEDHLSRLDVNFYLIGAVAKDMWMSGVHDVMLSRITNDLDLAVFVENENQYENLKTELINTGRFSALKSSRYTFLFDSRTQIDILPFGGLNIDGLNLSHSIALTAIPNGFAEVFKKGTAQLEIQGHVFAVSTLPGIVLLKLISYDDRPENRYKDLKDIANIVEHYDYMMGEVLFEEEYLDLLELDSRLTISAQLLGRQILPIISDSPMLVERVLRILDKYSLYLEDKTFEKEVEIRIDVLKEIRTGFVFFYR